MDRYQLRNHLREVVEGTPIESAATRTFWGATQLYTAGRRVRSRMYQTSPWLRAAIDDRYDADESITRNRTLSDEDVVVDRTRSRVIDGNEHLIRRVDVQRSMDHLEWRNGWEVKRDVVRMDPGFAQPYLMSPQDEDRFYCFYEYRGAKNSWHIAVTSAESVDGPYTLHHFPILSPTGNPDHPDGKHIADPTVLHFPNQSPQWHMWFDMCDFHGVWTIGHATSENGVKWTKQTSSDGITEKVLDVGDPGEWDDDFLHAPEAFVRDGTVQLIYNAQGTGHKDYDGGLAIASDSEGLGTEFVKWGQTTDDETSTEDDDIRVKSPIVIGSTLYALLSRDGNSTAVVGASSDGGRSWTQMAVFPHPQANSFLLVDGLLCGIGRDRNLYYKEMYA